MCESILYSGTSVSCHNTSTFTMPLCHRLFSKYKKQEFDRGNISTSLFNHLCTVPRVTVIIRCHCIEQENSVQWGLHYHCLWMYANDVCMYGARSTAELYRTKEQSYIDNPLFQGNSLYSLSLGCSLNMCCCM